MVRASKDGAVGLLTIDRPEVRNAIDVPTMLEMERALTQFENDDSVGAIVVTGAGDKAFIAGADISELGAYDPTGFYDAFAEVNHRVFRRFEACDKPTIGAVRGWALGGGAEFLLCLDIRILAEGARIGFPEINLGIFPGGGGTQRLTRQIPLCRAKELMFNGDPIRADEALRIGLVNRVVPADRLLDEAIATGRKLAEKSASAMRLLKRAILAGGEQPLSAALAYERSLACLVLGTDDARRGLSAFLEKRKPKPG